MNHLNQFSKTLSSLPISLVTPRTIALLFAGTAFHYGYITPWVIQKVHSPRQQLTIWARGYKLGLRILGGAAILGSIAGIYAFSWTKNKYFLAGAGVLFLLIPYTFLALGGINKYLNKANQQIKVQMDADHHSKVMNALQSWYTRHRVRIIISLVAAALFYLGQATQANKIKKQAVENTIEQINLHAEKLKGK